jgi:hydroxymethylbilane synthase
LFIVPQVAQGALAIECPADDEATRAALAALEHGESRRTFDAERGFLAELGGDCDLPAGAHATIEGDEIRITGVLASLDGHQCLRHEAIGIDPEPRGRAVARHLLDNGGDALL